MNAEFAGQQITDSALVNQLTSTPSTERHFRENPGPVEERLFPCRSNEEVRTALRSILNQSKIEVAGGIVRHDIW